MHLDVLEYAHVPLCVRTHLCTPTSLYALVHTYVRESAYLPVHTYIHVYQCHYFVCLTVHMYT